VASLYVCDARKFERSIFIFYSRDGIINLVTPRLSCDPSAGPEGEMRSGPLQQIYHKERSGPDINQL
jgi:hypothetical protein